MPLYNSLKTGLLLGGAKGDEHYNELLRLWKGLDALIQPTALGFVASPPGAADGDVYLIEGPATGAFAGREGCIARYDARTSFWDIYQPREGWEIRIGPTRYRFTSGAWGEAYAGTTPTIDLPDAATLTGDELARIWQAGGEKKTTMNDLAAVVASLVPPPTITHPVHFQLALSDLTTALAVKDPAGYFRAPCAFTLTAIRASVNVASTSGLVTVTAKKNGSSILSTNLTIDANEKTSTTAATAAVISTPAVADDDELVFAITGAGTGAKRLVVTLIGTI